LTWHRRKAKWEWLNDWSVCQESSSPLPILKKRSSSKY